MEDLGLFFLDLDLKDPFIYNLTHLPFILIPLGEGSFVMEGDFDFLLLRS